MKSLLKLRGRLGWVVPASAVALAVALAWGINLKNHSAAATSLPVRIVGFGPTPVEHGKVFNAQPNGVSAIWVHIDKPTAPHDVLVLDGHHLQTTIAGEDLLTAYVPAAVTSSPGVKPLLVELDSDKQHAQSPSVPFVVN